MEGERTPAGTASAMISADVVTDPDALTPFEPGWDRLATALRAPYCSPAWMLSWWRHLAPAGSQLRVVVSRAGEEIVGVAPFFAVRRGPLVRCALLAADVSFPIEPLAAPGYEAVVARSVTEALWRNDPPDVIALEGTRSRTESARLIARAWPGPIGARVHRGRILPAPALRLEGRTYQEWLDSRSSNFRQQMARFRRRLERKGATFRLASGPEDIERGLTHFVALHQARWRKRGGSNLLKPGLEEMLRAVASRWEGSIRFRLWLLEASGQTVSAQIFLQTGGELAYWNGGFDERWATERPAMQTILAAIEHAAAVGDTRVSLGAGAEGYKYRFADEEDPVEWTSVFPMTLRYPLARLLVVPSEVRRIVSSRVSPQTKQRLKRLASAAQASRGVAT